MAELDYPQATLEALAARAATQYAVSRVLAETENTAEALERVLQAVCEHLDWDLGVIWTLDEEQNVLRCDGMWHRPDLSLPNFKAESWRRTFTSGIGLPGRVWATAKAHWLTNVVDDDNFPRAAAAARDGLHAASGFPILLGSETLGVMEFFSQEVREPYEERLEMMAALGRQVGQFLERRAAETKLLESEARKAAILETALDCIITIDHAGRVVDFNPAAERTFGFRREDALARKMAELIIPMHLREAHYSGLARFLATGEGPLLGKRIEIEALRADGTLFPVEVAITTIRIGDQPLFTAYLRDITQRKESEVDRERLLESERAARGEAERANRLKDEFLSTLSHELRTPLNAMLGYAQLLRMSADDAEQVREGLGVIERNGRIQARIIEDLLDMSRIISGKIRLDIQPVRLASVIEAAIETVRPSADAKEIRLQVVLDSHTGPVLGDAARLQQIVWNLLSNAVKFTPKGGRIQLLLERVNSHLEINVRDSGIGIKPEFLPYVFDRFRQADGSMTRTHGGLGLGLAIVKHLVELHGGTVQVKSPGEDQGATFTVALPLQVVHDDGEKEPRVHPQSVSLCRAPTATVSLSGLRVLAVDDEPDARELVRRVLEERDATVRTAGSVDEAISIFKNWSPDVLISDLGMPGRDGFELIRSIRTLPEDSGGKVAAAALTAYARSEDRTRAMLAGYQTHVAKPVDPIELIAVVATLGGRTGKDE
jgi:PAS domain S-box-containing protein